jgi:HEAT repeat protein
MAVACWSALPVLAAAPTVDQAALDKAFETLKSYDWGQDRKALEPIESAILATHGKPAERKALEERLAAMLKPDAPRAANDHICRKLSLIGTATSVPALAALLTDKDNSHMARYALERMPCPEAVKAMRDALAKTSGVTKVGIINSLGMRADGESTAALVGLLADADKEIVSAAVAALAKICTPEAVKAIQEFQKNAPPELSLAAADACLVCAEKLLAAGKKMEALALYKRLTGEEQPKHIRVAATRGILAVTGKKD